MKWNLKKEDIQILQKHIENAKHSVSVLFYITNGASANKDLWRKTSFIFSTPSPLRFKTYIFTHFTHSDKKPASLYTAFLDWISLSIICSNFSICRCFAFYSTVALQQNNVKEASSIGFQPITAQLRQDRQVNISITRSMIMGKVIYQQDNVDNSHTLTA